MAEETEEWTDEQGVVWIKCFKCHQDTKVLEDWQFCLNCLTHL